MASRNAAPQVRDQMSMRGEKDSENLPRHVSDTIARMAQREKFLRPSPRRARKPQWTRERLWISFSSYTRKK